MLCLVPGRADSLVVRGISTLTDSLSLLFPTSSAKVWLVKHSYTLALHCCCSFVDPRALAYTRGWLQKYTRCYRRIQCVTSQTLAELVRNSRDNISFRVHIHRKPCEPTRPGANMECCPWTQLTHGDESHDMGKSYALSPSQWPWEQTLSNA